MDLHGYQQHADEKPRRRRSGAGASGSKKSTRRKSGSSSSSRAAAGAVDGGGDDARGLADADPRRESRGNGGNGGGVAARADLVSRHDPGGAAPGKDSSRSAGAGSASRTRHGAKGVRRGSGKAVVEDGQDRGGLVTAQPAQTRQQHQSVEGGGVSTGSSVDRAILQK